MADLINFKLPNISINNDSDSDDIKAIKAYLYQLTEQMKFYLNNIDEDNFNAEYARSVQEWQYENSRSINSYYTKGAVDSIIKTVDRTIQSVTDYITGSKGGYIVTLDTDSDGCADEFRILIDTKDVAQSKQYWVWNSGGLGFFNGISETPSFSTALAVDEDGNGYVVADRIAGTLGSLVTLNAGTITACNGDIGGWNFTNHFENKVDARIYHEFDIGDYIYDGEGNLKYQRFKCRVSLKNDRASDLDKKVLFVNLYPYLSDGVTLNETEKIEPFYIKRNGAAKLSKLMIESVWNPANTELNFLSVTTKGTHDHFILNGQNGDVTAEFCNLDITNSAGTVFQALNSNHNTVVGYANWSTGYGYGTNIYGDLVEIIGSNTNAASSGIKLSVKDIDSNITTSVIQFFHESESGSTKRNVFRCNKNGDVYLGTASYKWHSIYVTDGVFNGSDRKLKEDIMPFDNDKLLEFVKLMQPVTYKLKSGEGKRTHMGFIAQDVAMIAKKTLGDLAVYQASLINDGKENYYDETADDFNLMWSLNNSELIAPLWAAVQVLIDKISSFERQYKNEN